MIETIKHHIRKLKDPSSLGHKRSSEWPRIRDEFLKDNPVCAVCGKKKGLNVHHKKCFHLHQELELDKNNLITLCTKGTYNHHLEIGHLGNFENENTNIDNDVKYMNELFKRGDKK